MSTSVWGSNKGYLVIPSTLGELSSFLIGEWMLVSISLLLFYLVIKEGYLLIAIYMFVVSYTYMPSVELNMTFPFWFFYYLDFYV